MRKIMLVLAGLALLFAPSYAFAQEPPSSLAQICAATDVEAVDAVLAAAAETELVGALAPLATLTVPSDPEGVQLDADVTLAEVRDALDCAPPATTTPTPTPTETPDPTETPTPTTSPSSPGGDSDDDQVTVIPRGGVDTGDGSSLK